MGYRRKRTVDEYTELGGKFLQSLFEGLLLVFLVYLAYDSVQDIAGEGEVLKAILYGVLHIVGAFVGGALIIVGMFFIMVGVGWLLSQVIDYYQWVKGRYHYFRLNRGWRRSMKRTGKGK